MKKFLSVPRSSIASSWPARLLVPPNFYKFLASRADASELCL